MRFSYFTLQASTLIAASFFIENTVFADVHKPNLSQLQRQEQKIESRIRDTSKQASAISRKLGTSWKTSKLSLRIVPSSNQPCDRNMVTSPSYPQP